MSELDDLKKEAVERIYLIPDRDEGRLRYVWCDDPSPEYGMRDDDAVEYVRRDKYDALEEHVEALQEKQVAETCACSHDKATDVCIGHSPELRKVREERDALAAHVERLTGLLREHHDDFMSDGSADWDESDWDGRVAHALEDTPETSLTHLKAQWQADALEEELGQVILERDALAAHIQALETAGEDAVLEACAVSQASMEWSRVLNSSPATSLAHLKAQCWKEAYLAGMEHGHHWTVEGGYIPDDEDAAEDYVSERQAAGETND